MKILIATILAIMSLGLHAQTTSELRFKYIEKNIGLDKPTFDKLAPTLKAYIKAMKQAGDIYDDVKDDYKDAIKANKLTDRQAAALNKARFESEAKELEIKKLYYPKFKAVVSERYVYRIYKLASDKKSKFVPKKKGSDDDDE